MSRPPASVAGRPAVERPPRPAGDRISRELARWLEAPDWTAVEARLRRWGAETWPSFRRVVTMHGLAPFLAATVPRGALDAVLPGGTADWLAVEGSRNAARIERLHADLAAILAAASERGVEVMPLKGALLTAMPGPGNRHRPMADLDLLVGPGDRARLGDVLTSLGYRIVPERAPRPTHDVYLEPGGGRVVTTAGEHPDNPRRVEVHTEVRRHLWGWVDGDDLTGRLWADAVRGELLGAPATLPRRDALFAHLAIHASSDLLVGRGRLVQWLDLAGSANAADSLATIPHPAQAYPAIRLASRALPIAMGELDVGSLAARVPARLVRWAGRVPLDHRAGLTLGRDPDRPSALDERWERWRPDPWRLAVAYGEVPLPVAIGRHAVTIAGRLRHRG